MYVVSLEVKELSPSDINPAINSIHFPSSSKCDAHDPKLHSVPRFANWGQTARGRDKVFGAI